MSKNKIKPNRLDKIISYFSPEKGLARVKSRALMALTDDYTGASTTKRSMYDWTPVSKSADDAIKYSREMINRRSHHMYRNNPIVHGAVNTSCLSMVGAGLKMHSRVDARILGITDEERENIETTLEREWELFSNSSDCDISRTSNFGELQNITLRQTFLTGESFTLLPYKERHGNPYGLKIQIIEPERIYNESNRSNGPIGEYDLYDGIEKDKFGAPLKYHIASQFPNSGGLRSQSWVKIPAYSGPYGLRNILHHYRVLRPGQSRGISDLAPIIEKLYTVDKYMKAYLDIALVQALFTVFIVHDKQGGTSTLPGFTPNGETGALSTDDDYKMGSGAIIDLPVGDRIETASPGMPNTNLDPFIMSQYREIGMSFGIPVEVLTKHFQSSFTAAKAAFNEAWRFYKYRRAWLVNTFCQPIYEKFIFECVARGRVNAPGFFDDPIIRKAYLGSEWVGPAQGHLNPVQEAQAMVTRMDAGITTTEYETAEYNGGSFEQNIVQIKRETQLKKESGLNKAEVIPKNTSDNKETDENDAENSNNEEENNDTD